ncbi:MAG: hypothetical protein ACPGWR_18105 [Ardenticatenaceae bacterium]
MSRRNYNQRLKQILEITALDWLPIIVNEDKYFPRNPRPTSKRRKQIEREIMSVDDEFITNIIDKFEKIFDEENKRKIQIEAKATSLIGLIAIFTTFMVGFFQFLISNNSLTEPFRIIITILYTSIAFSLICTIILANRAVAITSFQNPSADDLLRLNKRTKSYIYKQQAIDLLSSYEHNREVINDKITYVRGSQDWFRNTVYTLLVLMFVLAIALTVNPYLIDDKKSKGLEVIVLTPTPLASQTVPPTLTNIRIELPTTLITATPKITVTHSVNKTIYPTKK